MEYSLDEVIRSSPVVVHKGRYAYLKILIILLFVLFGLFYAIDESQTKAYVSDLEKSRRATAIGVYSFITGLIYLFASLIAGYLWKINPAYAFVYASIISLIAIIYFISKKSK